MDESSGQVFNWNPETIVSQHEHPNPAPPPPPHPPPDHYQIPYEYKPTFPYSSCNYRPPDYPASYVPELPVAPSYLTISLPHTAPPSVVYSDLINVPQIPHSYATNPNFHDPQIYSPSGLRLNDPHQVSHYELDLGLDSTVHTAPATGNVFSTVRGIRQTSKHVLLGSLDLMDTNKWRPSQVGEPAMDARDWRSQLQADSRQRIVNKIMDTLKRHLPFSGQDGLQELSEIAVRFEEEIYTAATSQLDYLQKISLKMLTMETKSQNSMGNPLQFNSAGNSNGPPDPVLLGSLDSMDTNKWRPSQVGEATMDAGDWRSQLQADSRQRIFNKIMDTLKRHLPFSGQDGLQELSEIAVRFEEEIYTAATSQSDYLRKISLKMLTMETKSQNSMGNPLQSNSAASLDSSSQTGYTSGRDWQEEVYQKIKVMKEAYLPELHEMYQKIGTKLQLHDSLSKQLESEQLEKLKMFKTMLERLMSVLQISKSSISPGLKDKLGLYEKQMVNFINTNRPRKQGPPLQQGQLPPPHM